MRATFVRFGLPLLASLSLVGVGGCALMPGSGPTTLDVVVGEHLPKSIPYALVQVTPRVTEILSKTLPRLVHFGEQRRPRDFRFGVGDIISVTIFEASTGGLFLPSDAGARPGNFITMPNQAVDANGNISIPYANTIRAQGRTQVELQQAIVAALRNRAIEPQVLVSVVDQRTSLVTVLGEAGKVSRIPASAAPERILDFLARAGGIGGPGPDMWVMLERNGKRAVAPFQALIFESANNIYVHPDDIVFLYREPQTFLTFGALGAQQQVPFGVWRLSLAEAIAKAGGLNDGQADPAAVFLYRGETRDVAGSMGVDIANFEGPIIPIIYRINLRDPGGYFLMTNFEMRNKDVIHVSNSFSVESSKFINYLSTINQSIQDPIATATAVYGLRNIIRGTGSVPSVVTTTTTVTPGR